MKTEQETDGSRPRAIALVGIGVVASTLMLVAVAWLFVAPATPSRAPAAPSTLEHGLIDEASGGEAHRTAGAERLERYRWIDRGRHVAQIPVDRAIDAVVADPSLLGPGVRR